MNIRPKKNERSAAQGYPTGLKAKDQEDLTTTNGDNIINTTTLFDLPFLDNPKLKDLRIPFVDPLGNNFIECRPHFQVQHEDVEYTIGTPHDHTVGLCYNNDKGNVTFLSFTGQNNEESNIDMDEIFKIASMEVNRIFEDRLKLRRTPWTLTIEGDLVKFADKAWEMEQKQQEQFFKNEKNETFDAVDLVGSLLEVDDMEQHEMEEWLEKSFREIMGDERYDQIVSEYDGTEEEIDPEMLKLFDVGLDATNENDIKKILEDFVNGDDLDASILTQDTGRDVARRRSDAYAERLLSFETGGRLYSLVRMMEPAVVVGKEDPSGLENRKVLLTPQEIRTTMPALEQKWKGSLEQLGVIGKNRMP